MYLRPGTWWLPGNVHISGRVLKPTVSTNRQPPVNAGPGADTYICATTFWRKARLFQSFSGPPGSIASAVPERYASGSAAPGDEFSFCEVVRENLLIYMRGYVIGYLINIYKEALPERAPIDICRSTAFTG